MLERDNLWFVYVPFFQNVLFLLRPIHLPSLLLPNAGEYECVDP